MFHVTMLSCLITAKDDFYCYLFFKIILVAYCLLGVRYYAVLLSE